MMKPVYRQAWFTVQYAIVLCALGLYAVSGAAAAPNIPSSHQNPEFSGSWANDRGSVVHLYPSKGLLSGVYQTNLGQPDKGQKFPLTGFVQGDLIAFTVNFAGYGSMTSWAGQLSEDSDGPYIRTLWHLTRDVEDEMEDANLWRSITAGASDFRPLANPPLTNHQTPVLCGSGYAARRRGYKSAQALTPNSSERWAQRSASA